MRPPRTPTGQTGGPELPPSGSIEVSRVGVPPDGAVRAVAQFGSALRSGRRGPRFKSGQPDQKEIAGQRGFRPPLMRVREASIPRASRERSSIASENRAESEAKQVF